MSEWMSEWMSECVCFSALLFVLVPKTSNNYSCLFCTIVIIHTALCASAKYGEIQRNKYYMHLLLFSQHIPGMCSYPEHQDPIILASVWAPVTVSFQIPAMALRRKLPQISFLSRQNTSFVATKVCVPPQNLCLSREIMFVATNTCLSRQYFCPDEHTFVATKDVFCRGKHDTCVSPRQWYSWVQQSW